MDKLILESLRRLEEKVEKVADTCSDIKIEQVRQGSQLDRNTEDLAHHIKRTDLLEERVESHIESDLITTNKLEKRIDKAIQPLSAKELVKTSGIVLTALSALVGIIYTVLKLFKIM